MITVLAGGVGAARFLRGLLGVVAPKDVTVIVNTGDDSELYGLMICPDLDTITYTLAGASNATTGWGLHDETFSAMESLERYGVATWFRLGDKDLATHIFRTQRLREGATLSQVTAEIAAAWDLSLQLIPMSDDPVRTRLSLTDGREVEFQEYFVQMRHEVAVRSVHFAGVDAARPAPGVLEAINTATTIVIAPSNPILSIRPILSVSGIGEALQRRRDAVVAISPIVAGATIKGPADHLLTELGEESSAAGVARLLSPFAGSLVIDVADGALAAHVEREQMHCVVTNTIMGSIEVSEELARVALARAGARAFVSAPGLVIFGVEDLPEVRPGDDLAALIAERATLLDGDVVVVTQKIVSKAEGRIVAVDAEDTLAKLRLAEAESVRILRRRGGFVISETPHGFVCANAGVDLSNVAEGSAVLLPVDPDRSARRIRDVVKARNQVAVGVIISDTFGRPWRQGLTDVAIGCAGIAAVVDLRGTEDALGRSLIATEVCVADEIAGAAELVMGKASGIPVAVVRGVNPAWLRESSVKGEIVRSPSEDLFR